ncbi:MAG: two-component system chemotaxis sensor kinase CheA, partial [Myxococcota bacterium]
MDLDLLTEFLVESYEGLDRLDEDFVALEADPHNRERLSSIFRTIHTIKGTCGFLDLPRLEKLTHAGENLLSRLREGELAFSAELTTLLLQLVDAVRGLLSFIETHHNEGVVDYGPLTAALRSAADGKAPPAAAPEPADVPTAGETDPHRSSAATDNIRVNVSLLDSLVDLAGELVLARNQIVQIAGSTDDSTFAATSQRLNLLTT